MSLTRTLLPVAGADTPELWQALQLDAATRRREALSAERLNKLLAVPPPEPKEND